VTASNTNILCHNCGTINTSNTKHCMNCGNPISNDDRSTYQIQQNISPPPPPPYQSYPSTLYPDPPVESRRLFWTPRKIITLSITLLLLLFFIGGGLYLFAFQQGYQQGRSSVQVGVTPLPTATTVPGSTPTFTATSSLTPTDTATTSTSTATTPSGTTKNQDIPCTSCSYKLDIKLTTIVSDTTKQNSTWSFTLTNNDKPINSLYFTTLVLEDNTGQKHQGGGLASTDHWNMSNGQSIQTYATFDVVHGTNYLLNIATDYGAYQTVTISF